MGNTWALNVVEGLALCFGHRSEEESLPPNLLRKSSFRELKNTMAGGRF